MPGSKHRNGFEGWSGQELLRPQTTGRSGIAADPLRPSLTIHSSPFRH